MTTDPGCLVHESLALRARACCREGPEPGPQSSPGTNGQTDILLAVYLSDSERQLSVNNANGKPGVEQELCQSVCTE